MVKVELTSCRKNSSAFVEASSLEALITLSNLFSLHSTKELDTLLKTYGII